MPYPVTVLDIFSYMGLLIAGYSGCYLVLIEFRGLVLVLGKILLTPTSVGYRLRQYLNAHDTILVPRMFWVFSDYVLPFQDHSGFIRILSLV